MPFLSPAAASVTGHSQGRSTQDGTSGGESLQRGDSSSSGTSDRATTNDSIHHTPLLKPDEIARAFDRRTGRQVMFLKSDPTALRRSNYDEEYQFGAVAQRFRAP